MKPCSSCRVRRRAKGKRYCPDCHAAWMRRYRGERERLRHRAGFLLQRGVWRLRERRQMFPVEQNDNQVA